MNHKIRTVFFLMIVVLGIVSGACSPGVSGLSSSQWTVQGRVTCEGQGVEKVIVTDGYRCVVTNGEGDYSIPVHPDARFVYLSTPSGYLPEAPMNVPHFFQRIDRDTPKNYDFRLQKNPVSDDRHVLLVHADPQFFREENFHAYEKVVDDVQQLKEHYAGKDILGIDCGDLVGDKHHFYSRYIASLNRTGIPFYRLPGNHDLQFGGRTNETSLQLYEETFGPAYYSFNRGEVHYIILNNVFFLGRDYYYMGYIDEKMFQWLEEDLACVPRGSTVFVAMHIPGRLDEEKRPFSYHAETISAQTVNVGALFDLLQPYHTHLLSGHMHYNRNIVHSDSLYEHNTGAVCGAWWQGSYCLDGTPIGYGVYEIEGSEVAWYFKSVGFNRDHQMRVYPPGALPEHPDAVVANIWNWDKNWKVEWFEDGISRGEMIRFEGFDPEVEKMCRDKEKLEFQWIAPQKTDHLFRATPRSDDSEITVVAEDPFGNVYRQTIVL